VTPLPNGEPGIQVIIPSTRPDTVGRVLSGLEREGFKRDIILVDDTLDGSVVSWLGQEAITVMRTHGAGQGTARNRGAEAATAEWLLFLDDDVVIPHGFGRRVRETLSSVSSQTAIVESPIVPIGKAVRPYWRRRLVETSTPGGFLTACLAVRREAFLRVGGLSGRTRGALREDTDLGVRIIESGRRSEWAVQMFVQHPIEGIGLHAFLRTATFFREDAVFNERHPGYLASVGQQMNVGPIRLGGFRRRLGLAAFVGGGTALATRRLRVALLWWTVIGITLNAVHLRALRRAGCAVPSLVDLLRPSEVAAHGLWAISAGAAQSLGHLQLWLRPPPPRPPQASK
jgi:hypothetical protein